MMNVRLTQLTFWPCHENKLIKMIPRITPQDWRVVVKQALSEILIKVVFKRLINDWYGVVPTPLSDVCALTIIHHKGYTLESSAHSRSLY